jgi:protein disulfide-isomerase A1
VAENSMTLIEFFAPWCGHCKKLAPEYENAASTLYGEIVLASVDCTVEKDLCTKYGVQGFPTLKLFRNDKSPPTDYQGGRTADEIVKYLRKQNQPAYKVVTSKDELEAAKGADGVVVVGFFEGESSEEFTALKSVANALRNDVDFVVAFGSALAEGDAVPSVHAFRKFDTPKVSHTGAHTVEGVTKFIKEASFPAFGEIGPENYQKYVERDLPLLWVFLDYDAGTTGDAIAAITPVANQFRGLSFVKLDGVKWASHAKNYGVGPKLPGLAIEDRAHRKNYVFPDVALTTAALTEWVQSYVDGKLSPNVKSQEIPASQDEAVYTLVGKSFDSIVNDASKDVLVEFYAPWCGHCKNLAPKYEELAKEFQAHPSVVIAKIDATENDTPAEIKGFPTLLFYPSDNKKNPLTYKGERSKQAMSDWIWENAPTLKTAKKTGHQHEDL